MLVLIHDNYSPFIQQSTPPFSRHYYACRMIQRLSTKAPRFYLLDSVHSPDAYINLSNAPMQGEIRPRNEGNWLKEHRSCFSYW